MSSSRRAYPKNPWKLLNHRSHLSWIISSTFCSLSPRRGLLFHKFVTTNTNSTIFNSFVYDLSSHIGVETMAVFIMDNCSIHRSNASAQLPDSQFVKIVAPYIPQCSISARMPSAAGRLFWSNNWLKSATNFCSKHISSGWRRWCRLLNKMWMTLPKTN